MDKADGAQLASIRNILVTLPGNNAWVLDGTRIATADGDTVVSGSYYDRITQQFVSRVPENLWFLFTLIGKLEKEIEDLKKERDSLTLQVQAYQTGERNTRIEILIAIKELLVQYQEAE